MDSHISGHVILRQNKEALACLPMMLHDEIKPNKITLACMLAASAEPASIVNGKLLHGFTLKSGFKVDTFIVCALIDMYSKFGWISGKCNYLFHGNAQG